MKSFIIPAKCRPSLGRRGFSLVELLATIMVIGIMTGILVLALGQSHWIAAREGVNKRNAQALAALCMAAQAGGANPVVANDPEATVQNLMAGVVAPAMGTLKPMTYQMRLTEGESVEGAVQYLRVQNGALIYTAGQQP